MKIDFKIKKIKSVYFESIMRYLVLLLVPLCVAFISHFQAIKIIEENTINKNAAFINQLKQEMDKVLISISSINDEFVADENIYQILTKDKDDIYETRYNLSKLVSDVKRLKTKNEFIDDIYIYFKDLDIVVSESGDLDSELFYDMFHKTDYFTYKQWVDSLALTKKSEYKTYAYKKDIQEKRDLAYVRNLDIIGKRVSVVVLLDENKFFELTSKMQYLEKGTMILYNDKYDLMLSSPHEENTKIVNKYLYKMSDDSGWFYDDELGKNVVVSYASAAIADWRYVYLLPKALFWQNVDYVRIISMFGLLFTIVFGIPIILFFTKKSYNPIKDLMALISKDSKSQYNNGENEYEYVKDNILKILDDKNIKDDIFYQNKKIIRDSKLSMILRGIEENDFMDMPMNKEYQVQFFSEDFAIILIRLEDYVFLFEDDKDLDDIRRLKSFCFIITNVAEEMMNEKNIGYVLEIDYTICCIFNISHNLHTKKEDILNEFLDRINLFMIENFNVVLNMAVSEISTEVQISNLFLQAKETMEYKIIAGIEGITKYSEISKNQANKYNFNYSIDQEKQLINYIKIGDYDNAVDILNNILNENLIEQNNSLQIIKCFMFDLISTIIKVINEITSPQNYEFIDNNVEFDKLLGCNNIFELKNEILVIIQKTCNYVNQLNNTSNHRVEIIKSYIDENYIDVNLNVSTLAQNFNMSSKYLSQIFRKSYGISILDYIGEVRIVKAKDLIMQTNDKMEVISDRIGFSNLRTFLRTFKKFEGITPSQFRESESKIF